VRDYDSDDRTIGRVLADKATRCGDRPFPRFAGRVISYAQLDEMTNRYANGFAGLGLGLGAGDHVAMMMPNCPEFLFTLWGLGKLGAVAVPVNTSAKGEQLSYFLSQSDSAVLAAVSAVPAWALEQERETLLRHLAQNPDAAEGLAAFAERRAPDWSRP